MSKNYSYTHKIEDSEVKLDVKIEPSHFDEKKKITLKKMSKDVSLKGFRPGKAPISVVESMLGARLYEKTLENLVPEITSSILDELENLRPITRVDYNIKTFDAEKGVDFEATFLVFPDVKIGDLSSLKVKKDKAEVTAADIDKVQNSMYLDWKKSQNSETPADDKAKKSDEKNEEKIEITDEWVSGLGMQNIKTVKELREEIEKTLKSQKEYAVQEKYEIDIIKEAIKLSDIKAPKKLVDREIQMREEDYKKRIKDLGLEFEDFLRNQNTSLEKIKTDWTKEIEERAQADLLFAQIVRDQKFEVSDKLVDAEISTIKDSKTKQEYSTPNGRMRIKDVLLRQKAFGWIMSQIPSDKKEK